ncbi:MAG: flavin monoamine oxidase family protein [Alphaproteobacteria bacterium]|jgi:monoamine oxidase
MTTETDVVIIGAGVSGLAAARELTRLGLSCTVIEGSHRIGGRAYSEEIAPGVWFDLGCAWVGQGFVNPFVEIAESRGIALGQDASDAYKTENHRYVRNGTRLSEEQRVACRALYTQNYKAISEAARCEPDVAISDVIDLENEFLTPFLGEIAAAWGADIDLLSVADAASASGELGFTVPHGYGNLVAAWGRDVTVSLNTRADRVDWSASGVTVETPKGTVSARLALCTVSTGILGSGEIAFSPALPDWKTQAINGLPMGTENKMGIAFDKDVFGPQGRGHYTTWNDDGETAKVDANALGFNVASVFVGGRHGVWLEKQGQQAGHDFAVDRIADIFGNDIRKHVTRSIITAWSTEPWALGSWAYAQPGQAHQRGNLARPIDELLFFAGEATKVGGQGTCHGAYFSGMRAAQEIAEQLNAGS